MQSFCKLLLIFFITLTSNAQYIYASSKADIKADSIQYDANQDIVIATGNVYIKMENYVLSADKVTYELTTDTAFAEGHAVITDADGKVAHGRLIIFKDKFKRGVIAGFAGKLGSGSVVAARIARRLGEKELELDRAVFTPCDMSCNQIPLWQINARNTNINYAKEKITHKHVFFEIYGVPFAYLPYFAHPTPNAKAKSGLLRPKIKEDNVMLPFYFYIKDNMDFTISPRVGNSYTIMEGEFRHKLPNGEYSFTGSIGNPELEKPDYPNKLYSDRYYLFSTGNFKRNDIKYGFDLKRASDKAYLTNYHRKLNSSLTSKLYAYKVNGRDYFSIEALYFQDLRSGNYPVPLILPSIRTQNIFALDNDESLLFNLRSNSMIYKDENDLQIARTSFDKEIALHHITNLGHIFEFAASNRSDLYLVSYIDANSKKEIDRVWYRNIPEAKVKWRYPLQSNLGKYSAIKIEPTAMFVMGKKYESRYKKYSLIDATSYELSENNIFNNNRYSGLDFHEYGNRYSYGLNSSILTRHLYLDCFIGQLIHQNNVERINNKEYVGSVSASVNKNATIFYRFRKDKKLNPITNEYGFNLNIKKFTLNGLYTEMLEVQKNFPNTKVQKDRISQLSLNAKYQVTDALSVRAKTQFDLSNRPHRILTRTIGVTYLFNCASIDASVSSSFLRDKKRGITKIQTDTSFVVGLKIINM